VEYNEPMPFYHSFNGGNNDKNATGHNFAEIYSVVCWSYNFNRTRKTNSIWNKILHQL